MPGFPQSPVGAPQGLQSLPLRLQQAVQSGRQTLEQALARFQGFLARNPTAPGNRPGGLGGAFQGPHSVPAAFQPAPVPGGMPMVNPQGQPPGGPGWGPMPMAPPSVGGGAPDQGFNDPWALYNSALPVIQQGMEDRISSAMAQAGFGGNRYGSSAMRAAAQEGVRASNEANNLLMQTLYNQVQQDQNRALSAAGLGMQAGQMQDEAARQRFLAMFPLAALEQQRQDQFANTAYDRWWQQMTWPLQFLGQMAASQSGGSGGTPVQTVTQPARPGAVDWFQALGPLLGGLFGGGGGG